MNPTYAVQSSDVGDAIRVHVIATNGGGSLAAQSAESAEVGSASESAAAPFGRFGSGRGALALRMELPWTTRATCGRRSDQPPR